MLEKTKKELKEQKKKKSLPPTYFGPPPNLAEEAKNAIKVAKALKEDIQDVLKEVIDEAKKIRSSD